MNYVLTLAPITIVIIICIVLDIHNKKKNKRLEKDNIITQRSKFDKACITHSKRTLFFRVYVIYILPFQYMFSAMNIVDHIQNQEKFSPPVLIFCIAFEIVKMLCVNFVRTNSLELNKKGYISLIAYFCATMIINCLSGGIYGLGFGILLSVLFYIYMHKRSSLFKLQ